LGLTLVSHSGYSATIEVTTHLDNNGDECTLRDAFKSISTGEDVSGCLANGVFGTSDLITFSADLLSNKIILNNGEISLSNLDQPLTIDASAISGGITIDGNQTSRVMSIADVNSLTMDGVTITGGLTNYSGGGIYAFGNPSNLFLKNCTISGNSAGADGGGNGGAIQATNVNIDLDNCRIIGNTSAAGGGVSSTNAAFVSLNSSTISGNSANTGGGLLAQSEGRISLDKSTVSENTAGSSGGGISVVSDSNMTISNSTISGNYSSFLGGGLFSSNDSNVSLTNSTVSNNSSVSNGGGLYVNDSEINLSNTTFSENMAGFNGGGLLAFNQAIININNSIIANSKDSSDCYQNSSGINIDSATIVEDASCGASRTGDPGLLPLGDNGGPTLTHSLSRDSIARDTGDITTCTTNDQRDQLRDDGDGVCDVGSIESTPDTKEVDFFTIPIPNGKSITIPL
jgi:parallel beta-helix repeat protein